MKVNKLFIVDAEQSFWQLACIQVATIGLPGSIIGAQVANIYGIANACIAIIVGNLLLWGIGYGIVLMTNQKKTNAIQNIGVYLGRAGAFIAAFVLAIVFLFWYPINLEYAGNVSSYLLFNSKDFSVAFALGLGLFVALISIGGMRIIRRICVIAVPILLIFAIYNSIVADDFSQYSKAPHLSIEGVIAGIVPIVLIVLAGIINLPTFFRHSRSKADSIFALAIMTFLTSVFQLLGIFSGFSNPQNIFFNNPFDAGLIFKLFSLIYILLFSVCVNLGNLYFVSAVVELFHSGFHRLFGSVKYLLIGVLGTIAYLFSRFISFDFNKWETIAEGFLANLDIVLMSAFLMKFFVKHRLRIFEKQINSLCWGIGCIITIVLELSTPSESNALLVKGIWITFIICLISFFLEEANWAVGKLFFKRQKN